MCSSACFVLLLSPALFITLAPITCVSILCITCISIVLLPILLVFAPIFDLIDSIPQPERGGDGGNRTAERFTDENGTCIFNDVDHLLSIYANSTSPNSDSPQHIAAQWLSFHNSTEVQTCSPYLTLQKYVLAVLYYSTDGQNWAQQGNFLSSENVCLWKGVFCDDDNIVMKTLAMDASDLHGTIPTELGLLTELHKLKMASNALTGTIPTTLGQLTLLQELHLGDNDLTGSIPSELGNMAALSVLSLYENKLEGTVPRSLGGLDALEGVYLFENDVVGSVGWLCGDDNVDVDVDGEGANRDVSVGVDCGEVDECGCCLDCE